MYGPFTQELDSRILVGQLRIFWDSVAGTKEGEKMEQKLKAQNWAICNTILYILHGSCVFLSSSYSRTKGTKRMRNYRQPSKRKGKPCRSQHPESMNIPPEHTPADPLADKSFPGNNHRLPSDSVFQHSGWEGFETYKFQFPGRRAEDTTLQVASVRIPSQCSDCRQGLQQAGVTMRNSGCSPWRNVRREGEDPIQPTDLKVSYWHAQGRLAGNKGGNERKTNV